MAESKKKRKKIKIWAAAVFAFVFLGLMFFLFSGENFKFVLSVFREDISAEQVFEELDGFGIKGYITLGILSMLQVILTFLPAEPVQVIAGLTCGFWMGCAVCLVGVILGNTVIFLLFKIYNQRMSEWIEEHAEFDFNAARRSTKVVAVIFILYFLPAIPYGLICIFAASLGFKYHKYILVTTLGALPSVAVGVGLGHMAVASSWILSLCLFAVLVVLLFVLYKKRAVLFQKLNAYMNRRGETVLIKKRAGFVYNAADLVSRIALKRKVKVTLKNEVGRLQRPAIVLVNHGSFLDFVYAGRLLKKEAPNFVTARLYFYRRGLRFLMRRAGCFPKSMFSSDVENVKNCLKVISAGGVLTMMPEARLSTVGRFEGIQESTYKFIKKMGVPVYVIKLEGDFLAKPKWGDKVRKGGKITATLRPLFSGEQVAQKTVEELQAEIEAALSYDELSWLEQHPEIHYRSKTLAVGLENILTRCPACGGRYTTKTHGNRAFCTACNLTAEMDDRYAFKGETPFKNFALWYDWQKGEMEKEITENPDFCLEQAVTLKHSSKTGRHMLRTAGEGVCTLDKNGLTYRGTRDGEVTEKVFPLKDIYRLLFGAGEDFEIYEGKEIWYFVPKELRSAVDFYIASELLKKHFSE